MNTLLLTAGLRAANHASKRMLELRRKLRTLGASTHDVAYTSTIFRPNGIAGSVPPDGTELLQGGE